MIAKDLISAEVPPLRTSTTGDEAMQYMSDYHVRHLPIVNNEELLGLLSEEDILNQFDYEEAIGSYALSLTHAFVHDGDHIYEVMRRLHEGKLTVIPVIDENNKYLGVITLADLLRSFAESASFAEVGSVVVLEMDKNNYSLSQIARIVESENGRILNAFVTSQPDSTHLEVTIKINRQDINSILATFNRYEYIIKASFTESDYIESLRQNYEMLLTYLNV